MRTKQTPRTAFLPGLVLVTLMAASISSPALASERKPLNRSLYVPISFSLCEHLGGAVLYQDGTPTATLPAKRVFQFTYYPALEDTFPKVVQIRVEGSYVTSGEPFTARLAVTPAAVHSGPTENPHRTAQQMVRQRGKIDARLKPRTFVLQCPRFCARTSKETATTASNLPEDSGR